MSDRLVDIIDEMLHELGYDTAESEHLRRTPERVAKTLRELTLSREPDFTIFPNTGIDQMVVVREIPFYSLCSHHLLPFFGKAHVGYVPDLKLVGLSKIGRVVKFFSRGLNVQEELTQDIAEYFEERLEPKGVAVVLEGNHLCAAMRGAEQSHWFTTSAMKGVYLDPDKQARTEFLNLIKGGQ